MSSIPEKAILVTVNRYDEIYRRTAAVFGDEPDPILDRFADLIDGDSPVLDIGCGQGRNSVFLARRGLSVDALDPSAEALRTVAETAGLENLEIRCLHGGFEDLRPDPAGYGAILIFGLIPDLKRDQVTSLARVADVLLQPGGLLFITAFGTWDPSYTRHRDEWRIEDENSFCSVDGAIRTYLEEGELVRLFPKMTVVHSWEGLGTEHRHGDGPVERHGRAEAVLQKPNSLSF